MIIDVYLYDSSCQPLTVTGINVSLFTSSNGYNLDSQSSRQFPFGSANEWGVTLTWNSVNTDLEIDFADPQRIYSGNAITNLNGAVSGRLDIVLHGLAASPGRQAPPVGKTGVSLAVWASDPASGWIDTERMAAWTLIRNYMGLIIPRRNLLATNRELAYVAENWESALGRIGFDLKWLS